MTDFPLDQLDDKPEPVAAFPTCELHQTKIVGEFPPGCATGMCGDKAHALLAAMKRKSLWSGQGDPGPCVAMSRAYDTCMACQTELRSDNHVRFLREQVKDA